MFKDGYQDTKVMHGPYLPLEKPQSATPTVFPPSNFLSSSIENLHLDQLIAAILEFRSKNQLTAQPLLTLSSSHPKTPASKL